MAKVKAEKSPAQAKVKAEKSIEPKVSMDEHIGLGLQEKSSLMHSDLANHPKFAKFKTGDKTP